MKRVAKFFLAAGLCVCLLIIPAYAVEAPSGENPANSVLDSMDNSIGSDSSSSASSDSSSSASSDSSGSASSDSSSSASSDSSGSASSDPSSSASSDSSGSASSDSSSASSDPSSSASSDSNSSASSDSSGSASSDSSSASSDPSSSASSDSNSSAGSDSNSSASSDSSSSADNILNEEDDKDEKIPDGWDETGTYYYQNGQKVKGWLITGGERYWLDASTGALLKNAWFTRDGYIYLAKPDGKITRGWSGTGNDTFYFNDDGRQQFGMVTIGNEMYYFEADGRLCRAAKEVTWNGKTYYVQSNGKVSANQWVTSGGNTYYYNAQGQKVKGWLVTGGERYWLDASTGALLKNAWFTRDGYTYLAKPDGKIARGWYSSGSDTFYFNDDGQQQKAWVVTGGERYWFGDNGRLVKGKWFEVAGKEYYAKSDGKCARGWVTIGGIRYQFDNDGVYTGNFESPNGILGIDVSYAQGNIDWGKVKASGVQFAIIRVLGWDKVGNQYMIDNYFETNIQNALSAGIQVGAYLYSYAFNNAQMLEEVNFVLPTLNKWKDHFTYPIYIDYEDKLLLENTTGNEQRTDILRTGMDALQAQGYLSGFYTYYNFAQNYINTQQLIDEGYDFWVAHTSATANPWKGASIWQNSHHGTVQGINGDVDLNLSYVNYGNLSRNVTVYDQNTKKNVTGRLRDIVVQIVQNEVGSGLGLTGLDARRLYMAQAVAAHSWLEFQWQRYGVNYVPSVGLASPSTAVAGAANQVMRLTVQYNGSVANAAYGSCAGNYTNSASNMGWGDYAYLVPVESAYDKEWAPAFYPKTTTIHVDTMRNNIIKMVGQETYNKYANDMSKWITSISTDKYGNITSAVVCGVTINGGKFYENCWGLYGANLVSWKYNSDGSWTFSSNGNGHGVGLSQYGAAGYIAKGQSWRWVLAHYYPGTNIG